MNEVLNGLCREAGRSGIAGLRKTISSDVSRIVRGATVGFNSRFKELVSPANNFSFGESTVWLGLLIEEPRGGLSQLGFSWSFISTSRLSNSLLVLAVGEGGTGAGLFFLPLIWGFGLSDEGL